MRGFPPRSEIRYPGGATIASAGLASTLSINKPSTVVDNTIMFAVLAAGAVVNQGVSATGFQATLGGGAGGGLAVFWKWIPVAASETATSYSFTGGGLTSHKGFIIPYTGCDPSNPLEEIVRGTPASGVPTSPDITPDFTGLTLLSLMQMIAGGVGQTFPAGMRQDFLDTTASAVRGAASEVLGPATAAGTRAWGVAGNHGAASAILRPAA